MKIRYPARAAKGLKGAWFKDLPEVSLVWTMGSSGVVFTAKKMQ